MADNQPAVPPEIQAPLAAFHGEPPPPSEWFVRALAVEPERRVMDVDGAAIELLTWGEIGKPGLLLLHGQGAHADWWSHIAPYFAQDWRVAAISWSGMGKSGWRDAYNYELFTKEAFAAVQIGELDAGGHKPIFVGHSFGGFPTLHCGVHHADRMRGAVMVDSFVRPQTAGASRWAIKAKPHTVYPTLREALARFRFAPLQGSEHPYIIDHIARGALKQAPLEDGSGMGWTWRFDPFFWRKADRGNLSELLPRVAAPLALVWGERSRLVDPPTAEYMLGLAPPQTKRIVIPNAEHHIMVDEPLALIAGLRGLLSAWPS